MWISKGNSLVNLDKVLAVVVPDAEPDRLYLYLKEEQATVFELVCADNDEALAILKCIRQGLITGQCLLDWEQEKRLWYDNGGTI